MQSYVNNDDTGAIASIGSELSQIAVTDVAEVGSLAGTSSVLFLKFCPGCMSLVQVSTKVASFGLPSFVCLHLHVLPAHSHKCCQFRL